MSARIFRPVLFTLLVLLAPVILADPGSNRQKTALHKHRFLAFGTYIDILVTGVPESTAKSVFKKIEADFAYLDRTWSPVKPGAVTRLNRLLPATVWFSMAPSVRNLLLRAQELARKSNHLFNPAIGKLVNLWGFQDATKMRKTPPSPEAIAALLKHKPVLDHVELKGIRVRSLNAHVQLDFGAVAKGFALNMAIELMKRNGIKNAVINAGGDLKCIGNRGHRPWRIAIQNPTSKNKLFASVLVDGEEAVFTSGDYERFFMHKGKRYHHILDPRTGYPVTHTRSVTVIHKDAALADAAATALFIAGPKNWPAVARRMGVVTVLLIDQNGKMHMSEAMFHRLTLYLDRPRDIRVYPVKTD